MLLALQLVSTLCAGFFAGAALYITVVEHPVRAGLGTQAAATQWGPSYKRATLMQAPLALASFLSGTAASLMGAGLAWFVAAILIGSVVPITLIVIRPTNHKLLEPGRDLSTGETRSLLEQWGKLHSIRTAFSVIAFVLFAWSLLWPSKPIERTSARCALWRRTSARWASQSMLPKREVLS